MYTYIIRSGKMKEKLKKYVIPIANGLAYLMMTIGRALFILVAFELYEMGKIISPLILITVALLTGETK